MKMKASEVRAMSVAQLNEKLDALKKDLFFLRMQHATNQDRKSTRLNSSHITRSRMPSSA